ncbi:MAG: hypothetical protein KGS72_28620 [Cyanobacteria bacterium REEB67]|nr:hypothetical protein [Cyanobacteria bacterium REEB67]
MAKKITTFYAADDVAEYLEALESGDKSRKINEMLRTAMAGKGAKFVVPLNFDQVSRLLSILYERQKDEEENEEDADPMDVMEYQPPRGWVSTSTLIDIIRSSVDS